MVKKIFIFITVIYALLIILNISAFAIVSEDTKLSDCETLELNDDAGLTIPGPEIIIDGGKPKYDIFYGPVWELAAIPLLIVYSLGILLICINKKRKKEIESITGENSPFFGKNLSEEHKQKISEANKGKIFSTEHCKKISESRIGSNNPNYGKSPSEETRKKLSDSNKGKKRSDETCRKLSEINKGKHPGKDNNFYGKRHSQETKEKIELM